MLENIEWEILSTNQVRVRVGGLGREHLSFIMKERFKFEGEDIWR